jgi:L-ascorbate metabolism protein UlaG (beta-lactamase superfamily)
MQLTFHGHACVSLDLPDGRTLVIDPGTFSDTAAALTDATAVLVTHDHFDHVDVPAVAELLASAPGVQVWATGPAATALREGGAPEQQVHEVTPGQVLDAAGARVTVGGLYHPGDSFVPPAAQPEAGLDVLLVPVSAPWLKMEQAIDFARSVPARVVVPIHEVFLSDAGHAMAARWLDTSRLGGEYTYSRLAAGEPLTVL